MIQGGRSLGSRKGWSWSDPGKEEFGKWGVRVIQGGRSWGSRKGWSQSDPGKEEFGKWGVRVIQGRSSGSGESVIQGRKGNGRIVGSIMALYIYVGSLLHA